MTSKRDADFYWNIATFKVEDTIFRVPIHGFIKSSEVFEGMFLLPTGVDQGVEGGSDESPIVLDGYKEKDFKALLKIIYPPSDGAILGEPFDLTKEEWVAVLDLSTRWGMNKIRKFSISQLSSLDLSPSEKITLSRAHSVRKWFEEGTHSIVIAPKCPSVEELLQLGADIGIRLLWIRDQNARRPDAGILPLALSSLKCNQCYSTMFTEPMKCDGCPRVFTQHELGAIFLDKDTPIQVKYLPPEEKKPTFFTVTLKKLSCGSRDTHVPLDIKPFTCPSCQSSVGPEQFLIGAWGEEIVCSQIQDVFRDQITELDE